MSIFDVIPDLKKAVDFGTRKDVEILEHRCKPGNVECFSGDYENIIGALRGNLTRRDSPVDSETAKVLIFQARQYFYNNNQH